MLSGSALSFYCFSSFQANEPTTDDSAMKVVMYMLTCTL